MHTETINEATSPNRKRFKLFQIRWNEPLGRKECPYAYRWVFNFGLFSIRLHKWLRSDDKRFFHCHPFEFFTLVLRGGYTDVSPEGRDVLTRGSIRYRNATWKHYVEVPKSGALTLLLCGPVVRDWGYWVDGKLKRPMKYFHKWGHSPCDEQ